MASDASARAASSSTLLYDNDCGFCRWALGWVLRWDRHRELEPVALQDDRAERMLGPMPVERKMSSWHLVTSSGEVRSAGAAFEPLFRLLPGGAPFAAAAARAPRLVAGAYRMVAGNRSRLGPMVSVGAKRRADALISERS